MPHNGFMRDEIQRMRDEGVRFADLPPRTLFKFCNRLIFDRYMRAGQLHLGTDKYFRKLYEKGELAGDAYEGREVTLLPSANLAYADIGFAAFCMTKSYTKEAHLDWYYRSKGHYDYCVEYDVVDLFSKLGAACRDIEGKPIGEAFVAQAGSVIYDKRTKISLDGSVQFNLHLACLRKPKAFEHEEEYRFIKFGGKGVDSDHPLRLTLKSAPIVISERPLIGVKA